MLVMPWYTTLYNSDSSPIDDAKPGYHIGRYGNRIHARNKSEAKG